MQKEKQDLLDDFIGKAESIYQDVYFVGGGHSFMNFPQYLQDEYEVKSPEEVVDFVRDDLHTFLMENYGMSETDSDELIDDRLELAVDYLVDDIESEHAVELSLSGDVFYPVGFENYVDGNQITSYRDFITDYVSNGLEDFVNILDIGSGHYSNGADEIESIYPELDFDEDSVFEIKVALNDIIDKAHEMKSGLEQDLAVFSIVSEDAKNNYEKKYHDLIVLGDLVVRK